MASHDDVDEDEKETVKGAPQRDSGPERPAPPADDQKKGRGRKKKK